LKGFGGDRYHVHSLYDFLIEPDTDVFDMIHKGNAPPFQC